MSTVFRQTSTTSSFESPYVSLDLLSYLKSRQITLFQIFNDVIMPDFQHHLSKGKKLLPAQEMNDTRETSINDVDEEDNSCCSDLLGMFEEIQNDLIYINKACRRLKQWEDLVNNVIKELTLQSLDDALKERTEDLENSSRTNFLKDKLNRTRTAVSKLKDEICKPPELSSINLDSASIKRSSFSMNYGSFLLPVQLPDLNINKVIAEKSTFKEIQAIYDDLDVIPKLCLLCFSVFPENAIIKKKVLVHWWVGEGFIESLSSEGSTAEEKGNGFFKKFITKGILEPFHKKRRPNSANCKMHPSIRYAIIMLAERAGFVSFDSKGNPTANFSDCRRACLVKTEEGSSLRELTYSFKLKQENVRTLFNVNEPHLDFRVDFFSKMKYVRVLQLGRWQASAKQLVEVEDTEFLKGLKKMRHLRYLSLRGISRITELPDSILKLSNLRILNLNGCHNLEGIPDGIDSLNKLTHLDMSECYLISHMPKGLALLSELQVLKGFVIGEPRPGGQYCKLADLATLKHLRKLSIHVDRKSAPAERELSSLPQFERLRSLSVAWSVIYNSPIPRNAATIQRTISIEPLINRLKSMRTPPTTLASPSLPAHLKKQGLEKLGLQYYPGSKIPNWLGQLDLHNLKKLYIRGGDLSDLRPVVDYPWTVTILRLKFLSELRMDWRQLQALFPNLICIEKVKCPKLSFFPCDENGEWIRRAGDTEQP